MNKTVTIKMVAEKVGISVASVSKALNDYPDISEETKKRVLKVAMEMGYSPNLIARSLVKNTSDVLGIILRDSSATSTVYGECVSKITSEARKHNLMVMVCDSNRNRQLELEYIKSMMDLHVKGLIIAPVSSDTSDINRLVAHRCPVVYFGGRVTDMSENFVSTDYKKGASMAMEYLFRLGHRNIALFCDSKKSSSTSNKVNEYTRQMTAKGYAPMVFLTEDSEKSLAEVGYDLAGKLIESGQNCTAIYCIKDLMATGVIKAFQEKGKKIPKDISILGFDGADFTALPTIELTTVSQNKEKMAQEVVRILMEQAETGNVKPQHSFIEPDFVIRKSCGKPHTK